MSKNTQVLLAERPEGMPEAENFRVEETDMPQAGKEQVLCQTLYLSLDPYMRSQMAGVHLSGGVAPGECLRGETVSRVVKSATPDFQEGQLVRCFGGWQAYSVHSPGDLHPLREDIQPVSYALSLLGMPGLTAYAGLMWQAVPRAGETVVVPAAIGAVGAVVGQLAKVEGCRVVGVSSSEKKCRLAVEELGYDACIDRNTEDLAERLDALCPDGVHIYFDLVGGELLHTVSKPGRLAMGARIILCGMISEYNKGTRALGPEPGNWLIARATVHGLVVYDFEDRRDEFIDACLPLIREGKLKMLEDVAQGLEQAPAAFARMMGGENIGKAVVKVAD